METPALLLLFAASFVNAIAPGPVVVLTFGRAARSGLRAGTTVSLGVLLADLLLVALALGVALGAFALSASGFAAMQSGSASPSSSRWRSPACGRRIGRRARRRRPCGATAWRG